MKHFKTVQKFQFLDSFLIKTTKLAMQLVCAYSPKRRLYDKPVMLVLLFFVFWIPVFSQETNKETTEISELDNNYAWDFNYNEIVFIVNSFSFNINGFTRKDALVYKGELKTGEELVGLSGLNFYIREKTQLLINERVLNNVKIDYVIGQAGEDGKYPVDIFIDVIDTWNIVALPRPKYSSNSGFELIIKARDYNFLGTMSPLRLDLGYIYDEEKHNSYTFMLDSNIPFMAFDLKWEVKFYNNFNYRPDTEQPLYYNNTTGLSVEIPVKFTTITAGFNESFFLNEENSDIDKPISGNFQDGFYMSSVPYIAWKIPTGIDVFRWGELTFTPGISAVFNHEFSKWPLDVIRKGPFFVYRHNLGFNRVDWIGNFRKGGDVYIDNSFTFDFYKSSADIQAWSINLKLSGIGHFIITDFFGISANFMYRHWFLQENGYIYAGDVLRGVLDKDIDAQYMLSLNLDFPVRVLRFKPSEWFNKPKLRVLNFDLHLSPIIDTALYKTAKNNIIADSANFVISGGSEIIVFPEFFRSLYLRISLGWNLSDFSKGSEIYVGTDFHY